MQITTVAAIALGLSVGAAAGLGGYTFVYAKGASYLSNDAAACTNCHVMREQFDGWLKGSHRAVAACNDCHTPKGLIPKYLSKASNGFFHSLAFTTGDFPDHIRIKPHNREITEHSCLKCHQSIVQAMVGPHDSHGMSCLKCHGDVGHMR